ncbi:MAG: hypothetical protein ABIR26_08950 [Ramlibacter sp.]
MQVNAKQQLPTPTQLQQDLSDAGAGKRIHYSEKKGLHVHTKYELGARFGNAAKVEKLGQMRADAFRCIRDILTSAYGPDIAKAALSSPAIRTQIQKDDGLTKATLDKVIAQADIEKALGTNTRETLFVGAQPSGAGVAASGPAKPLSAAELAAVRANLPAGFKVDAQGSLSGNQIIRTVPKGWDHAGKSTGEALTEIAKNELGKSKTMKLGGNDVEVPACFESDFLRMDIRIPRPDGTQFCTASNRAEHGSPEEKKLYEEALTALRDFAGSDDAMRVLASTLRQGPVGLSILWLAKPDGSPASQHVAMTHDPKGTKGYSVLEADGSTTPVKPRQVGGGHLTLSKDTGGNFKISIDYPVYVRARPGEEKLVPLHENGVVALHATTDLIVNADKAHQQQVEITNPDGITVACSGRLKFT